MCIGWLLYFPTMLQDFPIADSCVTLHVCTRYGPFWIATTLVFVTAVTGNYASYVSYHHKHASSTGSETQAWYYDIDKVMLSSPCLFLAPPLSLRYAFMHVTCL